jgi:uncharacterized protein (TIGR02001 family)
MTAPALAPADARPACLGHARIGALALAAVAPVVILCHPAPARAQAGVNLTFATDYRYRGYSLTDDRPALTLTFAYDHPSGAYASLAAIGALTSDQGAKGAGVQAYAGYAARLKSGASWDLGVTGTDVTVYSGPQNRYRLKYAELYAGVAMGDLSAHLYYAPDYLGEGASTLYLDVSGAYRPAPAWRLFGHVGVLAPLHRSDWSYIRSARYDLRAGAAARLKHCELQLAWTGSGPGTDYPTGHAQKRNALVFAATYAF